MWCSKNKVLKYSWFFSYIPGKTQYSLKSESPEHIESNAPSTIIPVSEFVKAKLANVHPSPYEAYRSRFIIIELEIHIGGSVSTHVGPYVPVSQWQYKLSDGVLVALFCDNDW